MSGHLPQMAFSGRIQFFQKTNLFKTIKHPYSTKHCQPMSMNGGQTLDLSGFPYTFILRVTPGHWTKKAFCGRMMQLELTILFSNDLFKV